MPEQTKSKQSIQDLSDKVDRLISLCEQLKSREHQLLTERAQLIQKNEIARTRVEAMIGHLKNLQQSVG